MKLIPSGVLLLLLYSLTFGQTVQRDEPTAVEFGQFTEKEHAYSAEYKKRSPHDAGTLRKTVSDAKERGSDGVGMGGVSCCGSSGNEKLMKADEVLRMMSRQADAVVLGSPKRTGAHMLDDESYVYTAYDFLVKEVFRDNAASPIKAGTTIETTRRGGFIRLDGIEIGAAEQEDKLLDPSDEYVLFLRYVPAAGGYMPSSTSADFLIDGDVYESIATGCGFYSELPRKGDTSTLLTLLRKSGPVICGQTAKSGKSK